MEIVLPLMQASSMLQYTRLFEACSSFLQVTTDELASCGFKLWHFHIDVETLIGLIMCVLSLGERHLRFLHVIYFRSS
jgi:hypothetical protein